MKDEGRAVLRSVLLSFHSLNVQRSAVINGRPRGEQMSVYANVCDRQRV